MPAALLSSSSSTHASGSVSSRKRKCAMFLIVLFAIKLTALSFVAMTFGGKQFARRFAVLPTSTSSALEDGNDDADLWTERTSETALDIDALNNVPYERVEDEIYKDEFESDFKPEGKKKKYVAQDAFCNGHAAVGLYASNDDSITARKVRLKCSIGTFRMHACFNPKLIKTDEKYVARAFRGEKFTGESTFIENGGRFSIEDDGEEYKSVLVCEKGSSEKCESLDEALPMCQEETKSIKFTKLALKAATDAARFGFLGKGVKARKFRPVPSEHALMKQMNGERRQETCFFKEVVSEIKRGCDVGEIRRNENDEMESDGLNELVRGGYLVGFKGVAMVKKVKPDTEECRGKTSVAHDDLDDSEEDGSSSSSPSSNPFIAEKKLEFLVIEDITRGIQNASIVDVDVSGAPASVCRYCSLDVKNFRLGDGITSGDRFFWKREARCVSSKISDVFENIILNTRSFLGDASDAQTFAALLMKEVENIVELMRKQNFVEFTDSSVLLAYGLCPKTGKPKVRARVIDFGHATWKSIASSQNTLLSNKPWTLSKSVDSSKFTCGTEELMHRLNYIATGKPAPKRCLASCLNYCDGSKAEGGYSCRSRAKKDENPIGEEKEKNCPWEFKSDNYYIDVTRIKKRGYIEHT